jgi:membrane-bound ClpP family serine protease
VSGLTLENIGPAAMLILVGAVFIVIPFLASGVSVWLAVVGFVFVLIGAALAALKDRNYVACQVPDCTDGAPNSGCPDPDNASVMTFTN